MVLDSYILTGASSSGKVHPRLEIQELQKHEMMFSLYIRAIINLQKADGKTRADAWQEIAGIHGIPHRRYRGDPIGPHNPPKRKGYCPHANVLFPTWHRGNVLIMEQAITDEAIRIVEDEFARYTSDTEMILWRKAANELRHPYWDWSTYDPKGDIPPILIQDVVRVKGPKDSWKDYENPLATFKFRSIPEGTQNIQPAAFLEDDKAVTAFFKSWERTVRWPESTEVAEPPENASNIAKILSGKYTPTPSARKDVPDIWGLRKMIAGIFNYPAKAKDPKYNAIYWDYFSNTGNKAKVYPELKACNLRSLEEPHNMMHLIIGGNGHMSQIAYAGFDPIFYLHHCNIDRLYALWEYVYPDYWLGDGVPQSDGSVKAFVEFESEKGVDSPTLTSKSPLAPYLKTPIAYWDSDDVRSLQPNSPGAKKYYTYLPLTISSHGVTVEIDVTKPSTLEERIEYIKALRSYYGAEESDPPTDMEMFPPAIPEGLKLYDFIITAQVPQYAFVGSYIVKLYVQDTYVGAVSVFSRADTGACDACKARQDNNMLIQGTVIIPRRLSLLILAEEQVPATSNKAVISNAIKKHFSAKIFTPGNVELAAIVPASETSRQRGLLSEELPRLEAYQKPEFQLYGAAPVDTTIFGAEAEEWEDCGSMITEDSREWVITYDPPASIVW